LYDKSASFACYGRQFQVQVQQLHHNLQRMFGTLWNVYSRRSRTSAKDGGCWLGTMVKCQTATDERASQGLKSTRWRTGSQCIADGATALCGLNVEYQKPDRRRRSVPTASCNRFNRDAEEQRVAVVQATGDECL